MTEYQPLKTKEARLTYAKEIESSRETSAYTEYTNAIIEFTETYSSYCNDDNKVKAFDEFIKEAKARLSARFSHAAKAAKSIITLHYIYEMSQDHFLSESMSVREVDAVCRHIGGSSVQKTLWSGWFKGRETNDKSPYFSDKKYRENIHSHALLVQLKDELKELDNILLHAKATRSNPYQKSVDNALEKLFA